MGVRTIGLAAFLICVAAAVSTVADDATDAYRRGRKAYLADDYDLAINWFNKAILSRADWPEAYHARGLCYDNKGESDKAIADYSEAISLNHDFVEAYVARAGVREKLGEHAKAIADCDAALQRKRNCLPAYETRAFAFVDIGDWDKAIADFGEIIRLDAKDIDAYWNRGNAYAMKGELDNALADFSEAIHRKPDDAQSYCSRGTVYLRKSENEKAMADLNTAIRLKPDCVAALFRRGDCYSKLGEYEKCIADCTKAIRLDPKERRAFFVRGRAYAEKHEYDAAIADFTEVIKQTDDDEAIRSKSNNADVFYNRGIAYRAAKQLGKSVADFTEVIRLEPKDVDAYRQRSRIYRRNGDYEKAIADYRKIIGLEPESPVGHNDLAWLQATCPDANFRNGKEAVANAQTAVALGGGKWTSLDTLAAAYAEDGDFEKAREFESKAIELASDDKQKEECRSRLELYRQGKPFRDEIKKELPAVGPPTSLRKLMDTPLRDPSICRGPEGTFYLTGTSEPFWGFNNENGIRLWKSKDLKSWEAMGTVWRYGGSPWHKKYLEAQKPLWAPEVHYCKGNFWLTYSMPGWDGTAKTSGSGLLRSTTGKPEGPYEDVQPDERLGDEIDASLFEDDDGEVYFLWHSGKIARLAKHVFEPQGDSPVFRGDSNSPDQQDGARREKRDSPLAEEYHWLKTTASDPNPKHHSGLCEGIFGKDSFDHVGYEGMFLFKANGRYYLCCSESIDGRYSCMVASSTKIYGPYDARYEAIPHGGHNTIFQDGEGKWWSTYFGPPWDERPSILPIELGKDGRLHPAEPPDAR
jgi:tetratricopeptide (TPR) repeat protein